MKNAVYYENDRIKQSVSKGLKNTPKENSKHGMEVVVWMGRAFKWGHQT